MQNKMISKKINQDKAESYIWLQCENEKCMKWRKVERCLSYNYENLVWFCNMNLDVNYNDCCKPQEKISVPRGETIICSKLSIGELVWAKMHGYPSWPAVITADPIEENGAHIDLYKDGTGDPHYYHVEFLGKPRSHAWILARYIEKYSIASTDLFFNAKIKDSKKIKDRLQYANQEASLMLNLSPKKRLQSTVFKYKSAHKKKSMVTQKGFKNMEKAGNSVTEGKSDTNTNACNIFSNDSEISEITESCRDKKATQFNSVEKFKHVKQKKHKSQSDSDVASDTVFISLNGKVFPLIVDTNKQLSQLSSFVENRGTSSFVKNRGSNNATNSVLSFVKYSAKNKSNKEEKRLKSKNANNSKKSASLSDELPMISAERATKIQTTLHEKHPYNDEETFWRTYKHFISDKKKTKISTNVTWYNHSVSLFKLYQRVHLIGGYKKATSHWKIWRNICWNILDTKLDSKFLTIRKAYRKLLLPFEKYQKNTLKKMFTKKDIKELLVTHDTCTALTDDITEKVVDSLLQNVENRNLYLMSFNKPALQVVPHSSLGTNSLPTSNPNSPSLLSYDSCSDHVKNPYLSIKMSKQILNNLSFSIENHLNDLNVLQDSSLFAEQTVPQNNFIKTNVCLNEEILTTTFNGYDPIIGSQNVDGLNDVICELNEIEDTLLELAAEIMSGDNTNLACSAI
ncbi:uncharacterized protein LOC105847214 isoform X3 [Hydra vulgaris]|uniref:Uncharacterized protein LOC105847214 isoform X3 n=1 Tax=Hydra vulgaris TaxID=6087 RepID=A0ABM4CTR7_HYDVU